MQIVTGLTTGDQVIQDPPDSLIDGEKVSSNPGASPTGQRGQRALRRMKPAPAVPAQHNCGMLHHCGPPDAKSAEITNLDQPAVNAQMPGLPLSDGSGRRPCATLLCSAMGDATLPHCLPSICPFAICLACPHSARRLQTRRPQLHPPRLPGSRRLQGNRRSHRRSPPPPPTGGGWQPASPSDGMLRGKWWEIYQDPQLNQLEERIATDNPTLRQALETYLAARDQVTSARGGFLPHALSWRRRPAPGSLSQRSQLLVGQANHIQRLYGERPGQLGARFLGPHSPHRRSGPRQRSGQRSGHGQRGPEPSRRDGRRLLPTARPRLRDQAASTPPSPISRTSST